MLWPLQEVHAYGGAVSSRSPLCVPVSVSSALHWGGFTALLRHLRSSSWLLRTSEFFRCAPAGVLDLEQVKGPTPGSAYYQVLVDSLHPLSPEYEVGRMTFFSDP